MIPMLNIKGKAGALVHLPLRASGTDACGFQDFTYQLGVTPGRILPMPIYDYGSTNFHNAQADGSSSVVSTLDGNFPPIWNNYGGDVSVEFFMYFISASFGAPCNFMAPKAVSDVPPYPEFGFQSFGASVRIFNNGTSFSDIATDNYTNQWYWFRFRKKMTADTFGGAGLYLDYAPASNLNNVKTVSRGWVNITAAYSHELGIGSYPHGQNDGTTNINGYFADVRIFKYNRTGPPSF